MSRGPDAGTLVARAIEHDARRAGCAMVLALAESSRWASATFVGTLHRLTIAVDPVPGLRDWIDAMPEAEFAMRGHIVADLSVDSIATIGDREHVTIAVLTLIDA